MRIATTSTMTRKKKVKDEEEVEDANKKFNENK